MNVTQTRRDVAYHLLRKSRPSAQVWRYLRSKLAVSNRQDKLELTRRWRVWPATDKGKAYKFALLIHQLCWSPVTFAQRTQRCRKRDNSLRWRRRVRASPLRACTSFGCCFASLSEGGTFPTARGGTECDEITDRRPHRPKCVKISKNRTVWRFSCQTVRDFLFLMHYSSHLMEIFSPQAGQMRFSGSMLSSKQMVSPHLGHSTSKVSSMS